MSDNEVDDRFVVRNKKELYTLPSHGEVRELEQTQYLFKSNLFKLQMDEMLSEVRVNKDKQSGLEQALHHLKQLVEAMRATTEQELDCTSKFDGVCTPLPASFCNAGKIKFAFKKPSKVAVVGSYLLHTAAKPRLNVDLAMEMPSELFQPKDHLNHRYTCKRAFYLATIAAKLKKDKVCADVSFTHAEGNILRPILIVKPNLSKWKKSTKFCIRIFPTIADDVFKLTKLRPDRNSFRLKHGKTVLPELFGQVDEDGDECATPYYNSTVLSDILMETHLRHLDKYSDCANFVDATRLLKVWLFQRGMRGDAFGVFNGFCASMLLFHLLETRTVFRESSSFQMFRGVVQFLCDTSLNEKGCQIGVGKVSKVDTLDIFHAAFDVVMIDPSGNLNLLANMTASQYMHLKDEATIALSMLGDKAVDGFEGLFMNKVDFDVAFDLVLVCNHVAKDLIKNYFTHFLSRGGDWEAFALKFLPELVRRGLGDRATLVAVSPRPSATWKVSDTVKAVEANCSIKIGIKLSDAQIDRTIDMGPPADNAAESSKFRNFWGPKSELRRFASGAINEAVVWTTDDPSTANPLQLTHRIVRYLLHRHASVSPTDVVSSADLLVDVLQRPATIGPRDSERASKLMGHHLGDLLKKLREDRDALPLGISSLQGLSPGFRHATPFPCDHVSESGGGFTTAATSKGWPSPLIAQDVVLQFEISNKWPDDLSAIQNVKAAFYIKLAKVLHSKHGYQTVAGRHHVDVLDKPFAFRIVIVVPFEMVLAKQSQTNMAQAVAQDRHDESLQKTLKAYDAMVLEMERFYVRLPRHTRFIQSTLSQNHSLSLAMRLAKRWVTAHMHSDDLTDEAIELLVAAGYTSPAPYTAPTSGTIGFLRFLLLLGHHDWEKSILVVSDEIQSKADQDESDITAASNTMADAFYADRSQFPYFTISSPDDREKSLWTKSSPSKPISIRIVKLAQMSAKTLKRSLSSLGSGSDGVVVDERAIFKAHMASFDVLIHLKQSAVASLWQQLAEESSVKAAPAQQKFKNLTMPKKATENKRPRIGLNPVASLLADLRASYSHVATFYHDECGGTTVGVVWDRAAITAHPFKAKFSRDATLVNTNKDKDSVDDGNDDDDDDDADDADDGGDRIKLNFAAILEDFQLLGRGIVASTQIQSTSTTAPTSTSAQKKRKANDMDTEADPAQQPPSDDAVVNDDDDDDDDAVHEDDDVADEVVHAPAPKKSKKKSTKKSTKKLTKKSTTK